LEWAARGEEKGSKGGGDAICSARTDDGFRNGGRSFIGV
jgi:hypothetical protein